MRPFIICHMGTSIDGRLHPSRFTTTANGVSSSTLRGHYEATASRFDADGWIVGRKTMAEMAKGEPHSRKDGAAIERQPHIGNRQDRTLAIAVDPSGRVHYGKDNVGGDHVIAILGEEVSDPYLAELRADGVSYIFAGPRGGDLVGAMEQLVSVFGLKRLLLEGGGAINGSFLKLGLIDEFSTLIHPAVDGLAGVQSIVDYQGAPDERPGDGRALRLISCEVLDGGMVWLRHAVEVVSAPSSTSVKQY